MTAVSLTGREAGKIKSMKCRHEVYKNITDWRCRQIILTYLNNVMMVTTGILV